MRSLMLAAAVGLVATWLLLYQNELGLGMASLSGGVVYAATLFCPSVSFWLFVLAGGRLSSRARVESLITPIWATAVLFAIGSGTALVLMFRPPAQHMSPLLFSGITATYACSIAITFAVTTRLPMVKQNILQGNLLGWMAMGGAIAGLMGFWGAKLLAGKLASSLGVFSSLLLVIWAIVPLLLAFLSLLSVSSTQRMLGAGALIGLVLLVVFSRFEVFFSIWSEGAIFWPFVILSTLAAEAVVFRTVLRRFFSKVIWA